MWYDFFWEEMHTSKLEQGDIFGNISGVLCPQRACLCERWAMIWRDIAPEKKRWTIQGREKDLIGGFLWESGGDGGQMWVSVFSSWLESGLGKHPDKVWWIPDGKGFSPVLGMKPREIAGLLENLCSWLVPERANRNGWGSLGQWAQNICQDPWFPSMRHLHTQEFLSACGKVEVLGKQWSGKLKP